MKNKIFSVGIAFTFLLMAACSHKGADVTSLNIPPGSDIAKTPEQQTSSAQTPSSPTAPPTGPTISNLPPPSTPNGEPDPVNIIGQLPPPPTISGTGSGTPQPFPGRSPTLGGGITGGGATSGSGTGGGGQCACPSDAPQIQSISFISDRNPNNAFAVISYTDPSLTTPSPEIPAGTTRLTFQISACQPNCPAQSALTFYLRDHSGGILAQNTDGILATDFREMPGQTYFFNLSAKYSGNSNWSWSQDITLTATSPATNQPPTITQIDWKFVHDTTHSIFRQGTLDISNPSGANPPPPIPLSLPPTGSELMKLVFIVTATDPERDAIQYTLKNGSNQLAQNTDGQNLSTGIMPFDEGQNINLTITVGDPEHRESFSRRISVQVTSPSTSGGTNGGAISPGTLDLQFNGNGKLLVDETENFIKPAKSIIVQNNGAKFVVAGTQKPVDSSYSLGILLRYSSDGVLDASFGTNGETFLDGFTSIKDIAVQADGKIIVVGDKCGSSICNVRVKRLSADGIIDSSNFDRMISDYRGSLHVEAVKILSNGKILLVGEEEEIAGTHRSNIVLWRLNADGVLDGTFVSSGYPSGVVVEIGNFDTKASGLLLQENKIIVAGSIRDNPTSRWKPLLLRLKEDGILDTTFGGSNTGYVTLSSYPDQNTYFTDIVAQSDGKLVAVGTISPKNSFSGTSQKIVKRFDQNGIRESNFGGSGDYVIVDSNSNLATSVALKADGSILIGGSQCSPTWYFWRWSCDFMLQQLTASGIADGTFGPDHTSSVITDMESGNDGIGALTVLPNGKILAVGVGGSQTAGQTVLAIGKYNP